MKDATYWITRLDLTEHPEGGYFKETYRSDESVGKDALPERFNGDRSFSTAIYFLLKGDQVSHLHRIKSDELWHFYSGSPLTVHIIDQNGEYSQIKLGCDFDKGEVCQAVVKAGVWFGASVDTPDSYSLVGCTVSPGFDFNDFEMGQRGELLAKYPRHSSIIKKLTLKTA
ncbi:MAG: cupin domain-containing protein [Desulfobacterales bacterium]|nr:cupin domain-containing protein [Desulfobacterales bacterium]